MADIAEIQLGQLRERLAERRITLTLSSAATEQLALIGYDPAFGARPLKRAIRQYIETPLSRKLIAGEVSDSDNIVVEPASDGFTFSTEMKAEAFN
ncbi:MAG: hypothetical protein U5L04_05645 [Trueperaceae bacterium]|nr:hypothetical protein [Trueperaceae bacterium]